ncbi:hypothetical protein NPIL_1291 [Nephila pilipes]|uniref:Uncharacterized protein n=1 Tax=Nephila pilipes TaxID=299642 RepID=A0A8X6PQV6_NEPPI|nr:hypothetical protein NPIL_399601 [Nephila pilipes]GFT76510.1 hypothetical protein NPIL_1291 [Nephila pilipes]
MHTDYDHGNVKRQQNEMEFKDDSRSTISPISSISSSSIDTSSTCERKQKIESNIQVYTSIRQVTKRELAQNFSIHNDYEHPEYKSLKNSIRHKIPHKGVSLIKKEDTPS